MQRQCVIYKLQRHFVQNVIGLIIPLPFSRLHRQFDRFCFVVVGIDTFLARALIRREVAILKREVSTLRTEVS